jgi:uncharacterized protein (DUF488 family)
LAISILDMANPVTMWTIGHSTLPIDAFLEHLAAHDISALADVRRFPSSRRYPQYNREALDSALERAGVQYAAFQDLGGRRTPRPDSPHTSWRNASFRGYADYMDTPDARAAFDRLLALAGRRRAAVMCAEALWWRCHRSLIADYFTAAGHTVLHIGSDGVATPHTYTAPAQIVDGHLVYGREPLLDL